MSYPGFVRRLFASNGAGPRLRPDILPEAPIALESSAGTDGAATVTLDGGMGRVFAVSVAAPMTVAAANVPFGACLLLLITNGGSQPVTWGMAPRWANGVAEAVGGGRKGFVCGKVVGRASPSPTVQETTARSAFSAVLYCFRNLANPASSAGSGARVVLLASAKTRQAR